MFARAATLLFALPLLAVATPWGAPPPPTQTVTVTAPAPTVTEVVNQCTTGSLQCCDSTQASNTASSNLLLGLLGIVLGGITGDIGITCSPLSVIGVGSGSSCNQQTVCCENNSFNGLIAIGCTPININL